MPRVIELVDKKIETLFNRQDFEYLLERYMGYEAVEYLREQIDEIEENHREVVDELQAEIHDLKIDIDNLESEVRREQQKNRE
jgi:prefoldin subunit 5